MNQNTLVKLTLKTSSALVHGQGKTLDKAVQNALEEYAYAKGKPFATLEGVENGSLKSCRNDYLSIYGVKVKAFDSALEDCSIEVPNPSEWVCSQLLPNKRIRN